VLTIPGIDPTVNFTLSYNSTEDAIGSLGPGWTHPYAMNVTPEAGGFLTLKEEDGRRIVYEETSQGNYYPLDRYGRTGTAFHKFTDNTYQMTRKDGTLYDFNSTGLLTKITGRNGNALTLGYSGSNIETITDVYGRITRLGYTGSRLESITDPAGRTTRIEYDPSGFLRTITDNTSRTIYYDYDGNGRLYSKTDSLNNMVVYAYTSGGKLESATDNATGVAATVDYYPDLYKAVFHQRNGGTKTVEYDPILDLPVRVTQADDNVIVYGYDNTGRLLSVAGPGQYSFNREYVGNTTYETDGLGRTSIFTYNDFGQLTQAEDPEGHTTVYHYDGRGILDWVQNANGETTYFEVNVDPKGKVTAITDPMNRRMEITYDDFGYPQTVTDNTGLTTGFVFDNVGNLLRVTDPSLIKTEYVYDNVNRLTKMINNDNTATVIEYEGNWAYIWDANGHTTSIEPTERNKSKNVFDPLNRVTRYEYTYGGCPSCGNSGGDLLGSATDANGHAVHYRYDPMGRLERIIDALDNVTRYTYWPEGPVQTSTDANSRTTTYYHDPLARLIDLSDAMQGLTSFDYRPSGFLDNVIDSNGNMTHYAYDNVGRVVQVDSPDTGTTSYVYNPDGTVFTRADARGVTATYYYDNSTRLIAVAFPDPADNRSYSYDSPTSSYGLGRLTGMTDPSGSTTYHYDSVGRLATEERTVSGVVYTTSYGYDNVGNLISITYPSGRMVDYAYNPVNRPELVLATKDSVTQTLATAFVYDNVDNLQSVTLGNGIVESRGYDPLNRFETISAPQVMELSYGYDAVGNVLALTDNISTFSPPAPGTTSYAYQANRLDNVIENGVPRTYGYDNTGNTIFDGALQFVYNQDGRLWQVWQGGVLRGEYVYDGKGRRVIKRASGITTIYHYDRFDRLIEETDANGNLLVDYVYLDNRPFAQVRPGEQVYYYHTDHLGTSRAMTNNSRAIVWKVQTDPFGNELPGGIKSVENNLRFPGQYYDQESGLHYNYFRDYDPKTGRYIQSDPIGLFGGINTYSYVRSNPLRLKDPSGLWFGVDDAAFIGVGAVVGVAGRFVGDVLTGNRSTLEDYSGAAAGGAIGGEALLYTANPFIAGAVGGLAGNLTTQALKNVSGKQCGFDIGNTAFDTGFGALTGFIPGRPRLAGVNAGRGSDVQVFRQIVTKAQNGTIDRIRATTAWRMVQGAYYEYAVGQGAAAGAIGSTIFGEFGP
jgi:RHS repeat-associated protein